MDRDEFFKSWVCPEGGGRERVTTVVKLEQGTRLKYECEEKRSV